MKEIERSLEKLVTKGIEVAEKTGQFVIEQAPDLLQEFYRWHIVKNAFVCVLYLIVCIVSYLTIKRLGKKDRDSLYDYNLFGWYYTDGTFAVSCALICVCISGAVVFTQSLYDLLFILVAPKLYLIEYFIK